MRRGQQASCRLIRSFWIQSSLLNARGVLACVSGGRSGFKIVPTIASETNPNQAFI
jgi:hypothetical protein